MATPKDRTKCIIRTSIQMSRGYTCPNTSSTHTKVLTKPYTSSIICLEAPRILISKPWKIKCRDSIIEITIAVFRARVSETVLVFIRSSFRPEVIQPSTAKSKVLNYHS